LWAIAKIDLALPEDEIGELTIREYEALLARKREQYNREQYYAGLVAASVYNAAPFGDSDRKAMSPLDFVPEWKQKADSNNNDLRYMTPEEQKTYLLNMFGKGVIRK
jgi:hypothetical protein